MLDRTDAAVNGVVEGGSWVRITGLQSAAGEKLNGKVGQLLNETQNADGRFQIKIDGDTSKVKLIKATNFIPVPRDELVKTCRLSARGEDTITEHKVLLFPADHSMFTTCNLNGNVPVMKLCGLPLFVKKVKPYRYLSDFGAADNQRATYLMIEPHNGFAPHQWQNNVGPVLVYRPGGLDLSYHDMVCVNTYFFEILDEYSERHDPMRWLNQDFFQRIARREIENCDWRDVNILV